MRNWGLRSLFCQKGFDKPAGGGAGSLATDDHASFALETGFSAAKVVPHHRTRCHARLKIRESFDSLEFPEVFLDSLMSCAPYSVKKALTSRWAGEQALSPLASLPVFTPETGFSAAKVVPPHRTRCWVRPFRASRRFFDSLMSCAPYSVKKALTSGRGSRLSRR